MSYKAFAKIKAHIELEYIKNMTPEEVNKILVFQKDLIDQLEAALEAIVDRFTDKLDIHKEDCFSYQVAKEALKLSGKKHPPAS